MSSLIKYLYTLLILPLILLVLHVIAIFHRKTRRGIIGRYRTHRQVRQFATTLAPGSKVFLIHCSSMGEFEHIKPVLRLLRLRQPQSKAVVMFFSPSGYENRRSSEGVDLFIYAPFDFLHSVGKVFDILSPAALLISRYDIWPAQVWQAAERRIPCLLLNASIHPASRRLRSWSRYLQQQIYQHVDHILAITPEDAARFALIADPARIKITGDTKYEQVVFRSREAANRHLLPASLLQGKQVFVAGSCWPEDEAIFLPALKQLMRPDLLAVICPHEPTEAHLTALEQQLDNQSVIRFSRLQPPVPATSGPVPATSGYQGESFILVDQIGILANLYSLAHIALVGGGFRQNVHNVLEPAAYGIPVFFGPVNRNSPEAGRLIARGGGLEINSPDEFQQKLQLLLDDPAHCLEKGKQARSVIEENLGAGEKVVDIILASITGQD